MYYILLNFVKHVRQIFGQQKISFVVFPILEHSRHAPKIM